MQFDVVIVGGGLVGTSLALALKNQKLKIALIEQKKMHNPSSTSRAIALSMTSINCLRALEIWPKLSMLAEPILEVHVSEQGHFGVTRLIPPKGPGVLLNTLGFVISVDTLTSALENELKNLSNLTLFCPDEINDIHFKEKSWDMLLKGGKVINTKLIIAADGAESIMRKKRGIGVKRFDYNQTAILCNLELSRSHQGVAYERFMENGSIALLPLDKNRVKCVLIVASREAEMLLKQPESHFLKHIQNSFGYQLGPFLQTNSRTTYALKQNVPETLYEERILFIGNAANSMSPVAAQGFNLGLRDVAHLADMLVTCGKKNEDMGANSFLKKYDAKRAEDHQNIQFFTHTLATSKISRRLGMMTAELFSCIKQEVFEMGSGKRYALPKLCRGITLNDS